jgi:transcriptional regulator with XRE-family HTH domain
MAPRKPKKAQGKPLAEVLAERIRANRERLKWTQDDLAERMTLLGLSWNRVTVAEVEGKGRGRKVGLEELLALSMAFGVGVVHLLALDGSDTQITDKLTLGGGELQAAMTVGLGEAGPPELRRMQLEFQRERARTELAESKTYAVYATHRVDTLRKGLEEIEGQLAQLDQTENNK